MGKKADNFLYDYYQQKGLVNRISNYHYYYQLLRAIVESQFNWEIDTIPSKFIEKTLNLEGSGAFVNDSEYGVIFTSYAIKEYNLYDEPVKIQVSIPTLQLNKSYGVDDFIIIYDNNSTTGNIFEINKYSNELEELSKSIDVCLKKLQMPLAVKCSDDTFKSFEKFMNMHKEGKPYVFIDTTMNIADIQEINNKNVDLTTLIEDREKLFRECLSHFGIKSYGNEKRERMIKSEMNTINSLTNQFFFSRLNNRMKCVEELKKRFNVNATITYADMEDEEGVTENGNNVIE